MSSLSEPARERVRPRVKKVGRLRSMDLTELGLREVDRPLVAEPWLELSRELDDAPRTDEKDLGSTRVIQRRFNVAVPRARVRETTYMLRDRSEG